ncbi:MAG: hypothetical protein IV100_12295 [Myxococcales bacterium]|nr:hypothetical protein [Myxococcales bacterium]
MSAAEPSVTPELALYEREAALAAWQRLRGVGARHVTVIGPPGVGKRAFVRHVAVAGDASGPVVVTSTHRLGVPGEHLLELSPLTLPEPGASAAEIAQATAVRCLLRAARAVDPTLAVVEHNASDWLRICRLVDGLPGALVAVASRLRVLTLGQLADRLRPSEVLSPTGPLAALAPAWLDAVRHLTPDGRAALRSLAALPDAILPDTAEALVRSGVPLDVLTELRDASLLRRDGERLRVFELAKAAVWQLSETPSGDGELRQAAVLLGDLCRDRVSRYTRGAELAALRWMQMEQVNLVAAWDGLVTPAGDCPAGVEGAAWQLASALVVVHSRYDAGASPRALTRVLRFAEAPERLERAPLQALGWLARCLYDLRDVERLERVVWAASERAPRDPGVIWAQACLASARNEPERLDVLARQAVEAARAAGELFWEARSWAFCVLAATARGDWRDGRTSGQNGVRCAEALGSEVGLCMMLPNLVFVCARLGERRDARVHAERAFFNADRCADRRTYATTLANLAYVELDWDDLPEAEGLLRRALAIHLQLGLPDYASLTEVSLAQVLALRGDAALVEDHLDRAERRLDGAHFDDDLAVTELRAASVRADLCEARHDWAASLGHVQRALGAVDPHVGAEERLPLLGRVMALSHVLGDPNAASIAARDGAALAARCVNPHPRAAWEVLATLGATEGDWPNCAKRLAFLARVPLTGAPATEGGELAYHSSLAIRAAVDLVWYHLGDARRADVVAWACDPAGEAMVLSHDGSRFRPPGGTFVDLSHRPALVRLLTLLADARSAPRPRPLTEDALVAALWPGEKMLQAAATNRLQNALSLLRKSGLRDHIAFTGEGYVLEPKGQLLVLPEDRPALRRR